MHGDLTPLVPLPVIRLPFDDAVELLLEALLVTLLEQHTNVAQCPHPIPQPLFRQPHRPRRLVFLNGCAEEFLYRREGEDFLPDVVSETRLAVCGGVNDEFVKRLLPLGGGGPLLRFVVWEK